MAVVVLGMHRSGTSMVARMLNLCGVDLGGEDALVPANESNRAGHWEHATFVDINDRLLAHFGGAWDHPPRLPTGWHEEPGLGALRAEAATFIESSFAGNSSWGWKDPRTALTLPFWRTLISDLRCVVCVRNPLDVAASLVARNGMERRRALALWQRYTEAALRATHADGRLLVAYEGFFPEHGPALAPVLAFLGLPPVEAGSEQDRALARFVDSGLKHHSSTLADALADPEVFTGTKLTYELLLRRPEAADTLFAAEAPEEYALRAWAEEPLDALRAQSEQLGKLAYNLGWADARLAAMQKELDEGLAWHTGHRSKLEAHIASLEAQLADSKAWGEEQHRLLEEALEWHTGHRSKLEAHIASLETQLAESSAWGEEQRAKLAEGIAWHEAHRARLESYIADLERERDAARRHAIVDPAANTAG